MRLRVKESTFTPTGTDTYEMEKGPLERFLFSRYYVTSLLFSIVRTSAIEKLTDNSDDHYEDDTFRVYTSKKRGGS